MNTFILTNFWRLIIFFTFSGVCLQKRALMGDGLLFPTLGVFCHMFQKLSKGPSVNLKKRIL